MRSDVPAPTRSRTGASSGPSYQASLLLRDVGLLVAAVALARLAVAHSSRRGAR
ncbi:hypothetical protein [Saccharopolyspora endophytica]|uniref:Uncharacterized protein n=1 Tax=Saccharopolyspora endophytica TaxID=543886 RepID=A0ABS5DQI1_9PSEU|nr:hypothetical protein [Saccharopolyspora endophytica]MBQ0928297.1 hypothetical protein [Saccharopolyspora endophytica]